MTGNERAGKVGRTRPKNRRPTIGFLVNRLSDSNCFSVWQGVTAAAREHDVNVITFTAHDLGTTDGFDAQANVLYDMVSADVLDGLVTWAAPLTNYVGPEGAKRLLEEYHPIPIVIIETGGPEDIPRVEVDSYQPMREMVTHLAKDHGYRRIAFIRGPDATHTGARDRYQAYLDALAEHGLSLDPDLVSPPTDGVWGYEVGETAISLLLDQRRVSLEAVVAVNDDIAAGAMRALEARGIHVPDQVAVTGFDDKAIGNSVIPPLTTVSLQGYEHAYQATEMLLALVDGEKVPPRATVPFKLIIRQSCGCLNPMVAQAAAGQVTAEDELFEAVVDAQREAILSAMRQAAGATVEELDPGWAEQLLETFFADLKAETPGAFLSALDGILRQVMTIGSPVEVWTSVISTMRRCVLPCLGDSQMLRQAADLWLQAQVMVGEDIQLAKRYQAVLVEQQAQIARQVRATLTTTFDLEALPDILVRELRRLGIPGCYLSLYKNPQHPGEASRLLLAYDERRGRFEPEGDKRVFPSQCLVPEGMLPQDRSYSMVVEPLYFRENQIGFCMFEVGPREGSIYDGLRGEISSALQGALVLQAREEAEVSLQMAYTEVEKAYAEVEQQVRERTAELEQEVEERERAQAESLRLQQEVIEAQQRAIRELSTPIIPVLKGVIVMPLIGSIDTLRARDVTRSLLTGIREHRAKVVILDVTGVPIVDSGVAAYLNKTIQAARLRGARTIVTGVSDAVAETIVDLGIDWSEVETLRDLQTGLRAAMEATRAGQRG